MFNDFVAGLVRSRFKSAACAEAACTTSPDSRFLLALNELLIFGIRSVTSL